MLPIVVVSMFITSVAMSSPIEWTYTQSGDQLEWEMTAGQRLQDVQLRVHDRQSRSQDLFVRSTWEPGERWSIETPAPERNTSILLEFVGTSEGRDWEATVTVPVRALQGADVVDFDITGWAIDSGAQNELTIRADREVGNVAITVRQASGVVSVPTLSVEQAHGDYRVRWPDNPDVSALTVSVVVGATDGSSREYHYVPWSISGEVRHLNFAFNSAEIAAVDGERIAAEAERLIEAIESVGQWVDLELYVGGYTDTVGSAAANQSLSARRARAIGEAFAEHGVNVPIYVQGFGESALAVSTPDETESAENRRAVYVLRAGVPPRDERFPSGAWSRFR